ncbi:beta-(1--_2)glucan export ATP-binding/permease protein NdvA [Alsobacter metallidurans]|uniref:Beta-(1-->2)glucan export ATP-binding/permease protein NdvA n=1 Tax=Alsobacter metallidurans TaxID=340221 RepID=A0A917ID83_9HYPH|nr:glucan ABC transporter ATP-binding protein/ permease [Alsobacter metallidurans]GGH33229.1 beta-(1-->2)glucan export ATP-binding/permease protein NdvA [Alsobacter metallidurans]
MSTFRLYVRVLQQLGPEARLGVLLALANVGLAVAQFAEPLLFGKIIDLLSHAQAVKVAPSWGELAPVIAAWVGFGLFTIAGGVLVALHADRIAHRRRLAVMANFFEHVLTLPLSFHTATHSGRVLKVMLDGAGGMQGLLLSFFREHFASFVTLVVLLPLSLFINWRLGLLLVILMVVFTILTTSVLRKTETMQGSVERYNSSLAEHASDALGNVPVIQSFTRIEHETRAMRDLTDQLLKAQIPVLSWWALAAVATRASATLTILGIFLLGTYLNLQGLATVGQIVAFMSLATMLISRMEQVVTFINALFLQVPKLQEFFDVLDTTPAVRDAPGAPDLGRATGLVEFQDVSFSYDGKRSAVTDVSFAVRPGETVALVGATGSGKSTTLGLLHRAFDPQSGHIRIDGRDIRDVSLTSLRRNIGVVFQEPMLFAREIDENLRVGRPDATDAEITLALERAQAAEFIQRLPAGVDTMVGERGRSLSGGERQRISIARALLKDPPILILDEATSALDAGTEAKLQIALEEVMAGRTTFVIAHRLATIRSADRILVFDHGRIVETGSFDQLVAAGGRFAALAKAQFMDEGPKPTANAPAALPAGTSAPAGTEIPSGK